MPFHLSILFLDIPYSCFEGTVFLLDLIDDAFEVIIFVPDEVLGSHVAVEVDAGLKNIMVGVYFFTQLRFIFNSLV